MKKLTVHLRIYRSKNGLREVSYDKDQNVQNENQLVKLTHDTFEWYNFLKNSKSLGLIKMEVEKVFNSEGKETDIPETLIKEVNDAFFGEPVEKVLTDDQKRIQELENKLELMTQEKPKQKRGRKPKEEQTDN